MRANFFWWRKPEYTERAGEIKEDRKHVSEKMLIRWNSNPRPQRQRFTGSVVYHQATQEPKQKKHTILKEKTAVQIDSNIQVLEKKLAKYRY